jgi:hypothetical protein
VSIKLETNLNIFGNDLNTVATKLIHLHIVALESHVLIVLYTLVGADLVGYKTGSNRRKLSETKHERIPQYTES